MKITLQQIIDAAWQKFIVEDAPPALAADGRCVYRTEDGRACAVGLCIPDDSPATGYQGGLSSLSEDMPELFDNSVLELAGYRLSSFQSSLHDGLCGADGWQVTRDERAERYRAVAKSYGLTLPNGGVLVTP